MTLRYQELTLFLLLFYKRMLLSILVAEIWNQTAPHLNLAVHLTQEFSGRGCLANQCVVTKQSYSAICKNFRKVKAANAVKVIHVLILLVAGKIIVQNTTQIDLTTLFGYT